MTDHRHGFKAIPALEVRAGEGRLGGRLEAAEAATFQGRIAELQDVLARLAVKDGLPAVVALRGPPGIGKTSFVYALQRTCLERGAGRAVILDSRDFPHTARGLAEAVDTRVGGWPGEQRHAAVAGVRYVRGDARPG